MGSNGRRGTDSGFELRCEQGRPDRSGGSLVAVSADAPSLNRAYLNWKYYAAGPAWSGSRSYILSDSVASSEEKSFTHVAIWPIQL